MESFYSESPTERSVIHQKKEASLIIDNLTAFSTSLPYLDMPIDQGKKLLKQIQANVAHIHSSNELLSSIALFLFKNDQDRLKPKLDKITRSLNDGVAFALSIKSDFSLCIARLENIHENLPESNYKNDLLAILAQNRLKRANISQQTEFAVQFIEQLENYRDIKLFHLNEALQLKTKEIPTVLTAAALNDKCVRAIKKHGHFIKTCRALIFIALFAASWNLMATYFHLTWETVKVIEVSAPTSVSEYSGSLRSLSSSLEESVEFLKKFFYYPFKIFFWFGLIAAGISILIGIFNFKKESENIFIGLFTGGVCYAFLKGVEYIFGPKAPEHIKEITMVSTVDFMHLSQNFTISMLIISSFIFLLIIWKKLSDKKVFEAIALFQKQDYEN